MADEKEIDSQIDKIKSDAEGLLAQSNPLKALQVAISAPTPKLVEGKADKIAVTIGNILTNIKDNETSKYLDSLSLDERTNLMKFIYRGMAQGSNCAALLKWHAALFEKDGVGVIMRVLTDRK